MNVDWGGWKENSDCVELHGLNPTFAETLAKQPEAPFDDAILNVRPDPLDHRDRYYQAPLISLATRLCPPDFQQLEIQIRDQGAEGSCTGQALAAVIDLQNSRRRVDQFEEDRDLPIPIQVSARMLYEMARGDDEFADDGLPGSSVRGAIKGFFHNGVCDAASAPYFPGDIEWRMSAEIGREARTTSLGAYYRLRHIINDYHAALTEVGAILCSAMIHDGWTEAKVRTRKGRIRVASPRSLELLGAHAFAIVGYDRDGFYVLNSWGQSWGGFKVATPGARPCARPGIALWPYEDWQKHVLDAWVLRLSAPFAKTFGMTGGYIRPQSRLTTPTAVETTEVPRVSPSISAQQIIGHYVHLNDGGFETRGAYPSTLASIEETAEYLRKMDSVPEASKRYDRLLFYAHGGLNTLNDAANRTAAMAPGFKRNGVYPIFFLWRTGLLETFGDVLRSAAERAFFRTGGAQDFMNRLIEEAAQVVGRPIWSDMKGDADRSFIQAPAAGRQAVELIMNKLATRTNHPVTFHFVGHSAGAIFLGRLFEQMKPAMSAQAGTISLMAAACTQDFFKARLDPIAASLPNSAARCTHFILPDEFERADRVAIYRRSLLYLISNGLEGRRETAVSGMESFWDRATHNWTTHVAAATSQNSRSTTHGGFDNDPATMNTILSRVCGRKIHEGNGGFTTAELAA